MYVDMNEKKRRKKKISVSVSVTCVSNRRETKREKTIGNENVKKN